MILLYGLFLFGLMIVCPMGLILLVLMSFAGMILKALKGG
jgi:hypothetical protein